MAEIELQEGDDFVMDEEGDRNYLFLFLSIVC